MCGLVRRSLDATIASATTMSTPGIVISRLTPASARAGEIVLHDLQILPKPNELAQMPLDGETLVFRHGLLGKPGTALAATQIRMRAGRDQMAVQDRLDDVLQPRPLPDDLVATGHLPAANAGTKHPTGRSGELF
jgi:hypothetical protein